MQRILIIGRAYPNAAHGYINNDVEYLASRARVLVLSPSPPMAPFYSPVDFNYFGNSAELLALARQFKPDYVIAWLLPEHSFARTVAETLDVPFVIKMHTPDYHVLYPAKSPIARRLTDRFQDEHRLSRSYRISRASLRVTADSNNLRAVFCIPVFKDAFSAFFPPEKVFAMQPRIYYDRFHDEGANGERVMVLGSLLGRREKQLAFGDIVTGVAGPVDWYPMPTPGCLWLDIPNLPSNLHVRKYVPPGDMPAVYKTCKALVMIGSGRYSRGLSLSILEAQASGTAVIAPSLRPDFDALVTGGGGHVFREPGEVPGILKTIPDAAKRKAGFEHAAGFDIRGIEQELAQAGLTL